MARVLHQGCDDPAQRQQALVDVARLTGPVVLGPRPAGVQRAETAGVRRQTANLLLLLLQLRLARFMLVRARTPGPQVGGTDAVALASC
jgi:hypothetical protein